MWTVPRQGEFSAHSSSAPHRWRLVPEEREPESTSSFESTGPRGHKIVCTNLSVKTCRPSLFAWQTTNPHERGWSRIPSRARQGHRGAWHSHPGLQVPHHHPGLRRPPGAYRVLPATSYSDGWESSEHSALAGERGHLSHPVC